MSECRRAVVMERDGVLNEARDYVNRPERFEWRPGAIDALRVLAQAGWRLVIVTNQPGIARGWLGPAEYDNLTSWMRAELASSGIRLDGVYHCPHLPDAPLAVWRRQCACRKPAPGLLRHAARDLHLDLPRCVMVGPTAADIAAGRAAKVAACIRITDPGAATDALAGSTPGAPEALEADFTCASLGEAAQWLTEFERRRHA